MLNSKSPWTWTYSESNWKAIWVDYPSQSYEKVFEFARIFRPAESSFFAPQNLLVQKLPRAALKSSTSECMIRVYGYFHSPFFQQKYSNLGKFIENFRWIAPVCVFIDSNEFSIVSIQVITFTTFKLAQNVINHSIFLKFYNKTVFHLVPFLEKQILKSFKINAFFISFDSIWWLGCPW